MSMEAYPEAATVLATAGWKPHPEWGVYTRGTLVMGAPPDGQSFHVKDWARIPADHPLHSEDTPDTAEEAAAWLVARFAANPLTTEVTLETPVAEITEEEEILQDESNGETGEEAQGAHQSHPGGDEAPPDGFVEGGPGEGGSDDYRPDLGDEAEFSDGRNLASSDLSIDADFTIEDLGGPDEDLERTILEGGDPWGEIPAPPPEDFAPDEIVPQETQSGAFIFGDNLDQLRTAAIGRVIRYANALMPHWAIEDDARLAYLRNFAMGVSEKRWDDDPALSAELNALETTIRRINEIKNARDTKVEFLEGASREEIIDFAVDADWP